NGMFEGELSPLALEGTYSLKLEGAVVDRAATLSNLPAIETELRVRSTYDSLEVSELTADRDFLTSTASLTGGLVTTPENISTLFERFGANKETLEERHDLTLWDKWPLLVLFLILLTSEWVFRRSSGLV
ncbi:MAG: hypothetical protein AAGJ31_10455, partial [Verrucomicrobiota bacterium]